MYISFENEYTIVVLSIKYVEFEEVVFIVLVDVIDDSVLPDLNPSVIPELKRGSLVCIVAVISNVDINPVVFEFDFVNKLLSVIVTNTEIGIVLVVRSNVSNVLSLNSVNSYDDEFIPKITLSLSKVIEVVCNNADVVGVTSMSRLILLLFVSVGGVISVANADPVGSRKSVGDASNDDNTNSDEVEMENVEVSVCTALEIESVELFTSKLYCVLYILDDVPGVFGVELIVVLKL